MAVHPVAWTKAWAPQKSVNLGGKTSTSLLSPTSVPNLIFPSMMIVDNKPQ